MGMVLFFLVSGIALPIGLALVGVGAPLALSRARLGVPLTLVDMVLALASAIPLSPLLYALLVVTFAAWVGVMSRQHSPRGIVTGVLLAVALTVALAGWLSGPFSTRPSASSRPVFVLGDSLSAGTGASRSGTWPSMLADRTGRRVENLARAGARLRDGISQAQAIPAGESMVLIELGGNDLLGGADVDDFEKDLRGLMASVMKPDRSVVMLELPLLPLQNRFGSVQHKVCAELGVSLIPRRILAGAIALPGHSTDGLHLSETGHRWLAERLASWI